MGAISIRNVVKRYGSGAKANPVILKTYGLPVDRRL